MWLPCWNSARTQGHKAHCGETQMGCCGSQCRALPNCALSISIVQAPHLQSNQALIVTEEKCQLSVMQIPSGVLTLSAIQSQTEVCCVQVLWIVLFLSPYFHGDHKGSLGTVVIALEGLYWFQPAVQLNKTNHANPSKGIDQQGFVLLSFRYKHPAFQCNQCRGKEEFSSSRTETEL